MQLPPYLIQQLLDGKVVLFLGAGASKESRNSKGETPPTGAQLGIMISDKFLGGKFTDRPLTQISEYAINESDFLTFQNFLKEIFEDFKPTDVFRGITKLRWVSIVTTNYDRLIEKSYENSSSAFQIVVPFIEDKDRVEDKMKSDKDIKLLKLHGCISRINNEDCPLIISTDHYINYKKERRNVFGQFETFAYDRSILFIGYSLNDPNFRIVLDQLEKDTRNNNRPRYYAIMPDFEPEESRFWETKKITLLKGTFSDFVTEIDNFLPNNYRDLLKIEKKEVDHSIENKFLNNDSKLSPSCIEFLNTDVDYVNGIQSTKIIKAKDFYKGYNDDWSAIEKKLDVRREASDEILLKKFLIDENEHEEKIELIVLLAHAGAGKSITLRRIAWDAAKEFDKLCLYVKEGGEINTNSIQEIINLTGERVFLFVDNMSKRIRELKHLFNNLGVEGKKLTIVGSERINEWNMFCEDLYPYVSNKKELKYLNTKEIDNLIDLLTKNNSLGTLKGKSLEECRSAFAELAGRQLLVALHEATLGKKYEEILIDEFNNISPQKAQSIYLTVCVLNRLDIPVRAGIISRIHDIPFEIFEKEFFLPLEEVVFSKFNSVLKEWEYRARHPYIAQIIFEQKLKDQNDRFSEYIRCLKELNTSYSSDEKAFKQMIRANDLLKLFTDTEKIRYVYETAMEILGEDSVLYHQMAIYEMKRPGSNLKESLRLLKKALELSPDNDSIKHSLAENNLLMVEEVPSELEKDKLRNEAMTLASSLTKTSVKSSYAYHTIAKIGLNRLESLLKKGEFENSSIEIENNVKLIQKNLTEGMQRYPSNSYLLTAEADLAKLVADSSKVISCLEKAFETNRMNSFIAIRLSQTYVSKGEFNLAKNVLQKALNANRSDSKLHYYYAKNLISLNINNEDEIFYHLERAFTPGDKNYDAQILYGRQLFLSSKNNSNYKDIFKTLEKTRLPYEDKIKKLYPTSEKFIGQIVRIEANFCIIQRDGIADRLIILNEDIKKDILKNLTYNTRVYFKVAFSFKGPIAFDLEIINF